MKGLYKLSNIKTFKRDVKNFIYTAVADFGSLVHFPVG